MKKFILGILIFVSLQSKCQNIDSLINSLSLELEKSYVEVVKNNYGFSPMNLDDANRDLFSPKKNVALLALRKLVVQKKFSSYSAALNYILLPLNKSFIENYSEKQYPSIKTNRAFFSKVNNYVCDYATSVMNKKSIDQYIVEFLSDTALIKEYFAILTSYPQDKKAEFLMGMLMYAQVNCKQYFDKVTVIIKETMPEYVEGAITYLKASLLENSVKLYKQGKRDSLKILFPNYVEAESVINKISKLYSTYNNIQYGFDIVFNSERIERVSSFIINLNENKVVKILGQAIWEIALDKPNFYIRTMKIVDRDKIQNIGSLEKKIQSSF